MRTSSLFLEYRTPHDQDTTNGLALYGQQVGSYTIPETLHDTAYSLRR